MADVRIKDLAATAALLAPDDFAELDGTVNGSRKLSAATLAALRNALANSPGLYCDGTTAPVSIPAAAAWAPGVDDLTVYWKGQLDDYTPTANKVLVDWVASNLGLRLTLLTTGFLRLQFGNGANLTTYSFDSTAKVSDMVPDGWPVHLSVACARAGNATFRLNGVTLGNAVSIAAAAGQTLTSSSALRLMTDGTNHTAGYLFGGFSPLYNFALGDTDSAEIFLRGGAVLNRHKSGSQANTLNAQDSAFGSAGVGGWSSVGLVSLTNVSNAMSIAFGAATTAARLAFAWVVGSYRFSFSAFASSGTPANVSIGASIGGTNAVVLPTGSVATYTGTFTAVPGLSNTLQFLMSGNAGSQVLQVDDIVLTPLGATITLPLDDGAGYQLQEAANRCHGLIPASGVAHLIASDGPLPVRYITDGTTAAQKLCGGTTIPAGSQILRVLARAQSGTPNFILGVASGGSTVVASVALSTTWKDCTVALAGGILSSNTDLWTALSAVSVVEILVFWAPLRP